MISRITWLPNNRTYEVSRDKPLLHSLLEQGVDLQFDCLFGHCSRCLLVMRAGEVDHHDVPGISEEERQAGLILPCSSKPISENITINLVKPSDLF